MVSSLLQTVINHLRYLIYELEPSAGLFMAATLNQISRLLNDFPLKKISAETFVTLNKV